jgi:hypothetical protein
MWLEWGMAGGGGGICETAANEEEETERTTTPPAAYYISCYIIFKMSFSVTWLAIPYFLIAFCKAPGGKFKSRVSSSCPSEPFMKAFNTDF